MSYSHRPVEGETELPPWEPEEKLEDGVEELKDTAEADADMTLKE